MIDKLRIDLPKFGGRATHTRCFLHTVNLVAKSLIREFEGSKERDAGDLEVGGFDSDDAIDDDNSDGLGDSDELLGTNEHEELQNDVRPIKEALAKVRTSNVYDNNPNLLLTMIRSDNYHTKL